MVGRVVVATCEGFLEDGSLLSEHQVAAREPAPPPGEPAAYVPDREAPTDDAYGAMRVEVQEDPEDVAAA